MVAWAKVAKSAFEVFEDIRSAVSMYMFILEEAIQTLNMANWILYKAQLYDDMKININYVRNNLAQPLKDFSSGPVGYIAYPMNLSYEAFADATLKSLEALEKAIAAITGT